MAGQFGGHEQLDTQLDRFGHVLRDFAQPDRAAFAIRGHELNSTAAVGLS